MTSTVLSSSGTGLTLRESRDADVAAIQAIYAHHVRFGLGSFEEVPPDVGEMGARRAAVLARGLPYLVCEVDSRVAGYAYAGPFRTRSAYRFAVEDSIYIDPGYQRRGIARRLLAELIVRCEAQGYRQMLAVIGDSGNRGSIGLHAALGFRTVAQLQAVGYKFGRWIDSVIMQRALGPGDEAEPDTAAPANRGY